MLLRSRLGLSPLPQPSWGREERPKLGEGKGAQLGEPCPKVRLSQDRLPIFSPHLAYHEGKGAKLGEGKILAVNSLLSVFH